MKRYFIVFMALALFTNPSFAKAVDKKSTDDKEQTIVIVVENNQKNEASKDVDPFLASTVRGLNTVQNASENAGILNCNCIVKDGDVYVAFAMGTGSASEGGNLAWKAFSLRLGKSITDKARIDFIHFNEGHPQNNHRDGFAMQGTYKVSATDKLAIEAALGPYFSMNTTVIKGEELDDKRLGVLATIAATYSLDSISKGLHVRAEYNHAAMPGALKTDSIMVGVGKNFDSKKRSTGSDSKKDVEVAVIGDLFITNHGDVDETPKGYQIEVKKELSAHTAASVSYMKEGVDSRVDRQGVAAEFWYAEPLSKNMSISAGAGVYLADNKLDKNDGKVNGIISIEVKRKVGKDMNVFVRVNRIADFKGSNDRDVIGVGLAGKF